MNLENPTLKEVVESDTELKQFLIKYAGEKHKPIDDIVTVEMIVSTLADDFPEIVLALSEENFIRGYEQAVNDIYSNDQQEK